jgi:Holliday junction resolvase
MAQTPEKKVKDKVTAVLKEYGAYYFFPPSNGFGRAGIPDIIACLHGHFVAIECKAGSNKPTALQLRELQSIYLAGATALLIRETNIHEVQQHLQQDLYLNYMLINL